MIAYDYPTVDLAFEAGRVILSKLTGGTVALAELVQAGFVIEGYALSMTVPVGLAAATTGTPMTEGELKAALEGFTAAPASGRSAAATAINWKAMLLPLLDLLRQWLLTQ